jgi:putative chitobiose transport system permease protein
MISHKQLTPYYYLALPVGILGLFFVWPVAMATWLSLQDYSYNLYHPTFIGLDNYWALLNNASFWQSVGVTLCYIVGIVPAMVALPIGLAIVTQGPLPGMALFRLLLYVPVILSMVVVGLAWKWLLAGDGLINTALHGLGLPSVAWLVNPDIAIVSVMVVVVWKGLAYYMMLYLSQLQTLSAELYQAAAIDGANGWQKHWYVTLPHLRPTMGLIALMSIIGCLKLFPEVYVLTQGGPLGSTKPLVYWIYQQAFQHLNLGLASAGGLLLLVPLVGLSLLQLKRQKT